MYWAVNRGLSKIKIKDYDGAIEDFSKVKELNPSNNLALSNIEDIEKKIYEKSEKALIDKGFSNLQSENYQESISDFTKAIEINPSNSYSFETRAYSRAKIGDFKGAINDLSEAIRLNPTSYPYILRGYYKIFPPLIFRYDGNLHDAMDLRTILNCIKDIHTFYGPGLPIEISSTKETDRTEKPSFSAFKRWKLVENVYNHAELRPNLGYDETI